MLRYLFGKKPEGKIETQRETFVRQVKELTATIEAMPQKPKVSIDPKTGAITFEAPEQFADEALALPAPDATAPETQSTSPVTEAATNPAPPKAMPPKAAPPKASPPKAAPPKAAA
ncbi:MAG: hypothetical protein AAFZ02_04430 [Pseudomonadota bacterium]